MFVAFRINDLEMVTLTGGRSTLPVETPRFRLTASAVGRTLAFGKLRLRTC